MDSKEKKIIELQVNHLLESIQLRLSIVMKSAEKPSKLDIDSLKDKIRDLYDHVLNLELMEEDAKEEKKPVEQPVIERVQEKVKENKKKETVKKATEKPQEPRKEEIPKKEVIVEKSTSEPADDVKPVIKEPNLSPSKKADILKEKQTTIADKFMNGDDKSVAAKIQKNPISDLRLAIGVNDKFLFIKELFEGNLDSYNEAIRALNSFTEKEKAQNFLNDLNKQYNWPEDSFYGAKLSELVERKFM